MYPEEVSRVLSVKGMRRLTGRTMSTRSRIAIELRRARKAGFAIDDEEYCLGLRCVAAAMTDEHGQPLGAISISGPSIRITRDRLQELGKLVSSVADELTGELGGKRDALDPDLSTAISPKFPHCGRCAHLKNDILCSKASANPIDFLPFLLSCRDAGGAVRLRARRDSS